MALISFCIWFDYDRSLFDPDGLSGRCLSSFVDQFLELSLGDPTSCGSTFLMNDVVRRIGEKVAEAGSGCTIIPEAPPVEESQSNGSIEDSRSFAGHNTSLACLETSRIQL